MAAAGCTVPGLGASGSKLGCSGDGADDAPVAPAGAGGVEGSRPGATVGSGLTSAGDMGAGDVDSAGIAIGGVTVVATGAAGVG